MMYLHSAMLLNYTYFYDSQSLSNILPMGVADTKITNEILCGDGLKPAVQKSLIGCIGCIIMMTSSNGHIFRVTGALCGEFTGRRWIPCTHKGQWRGALMFSLICAWINGWVNNRGAGDLRHHRAHYDVAEMIIIHESHFATALFKTHHRV